MAQPSADAITGREGRIDPSSPVGALAECYRAWIRISRIFRRVDGRWRQIHHHGSIDDADLLARYQAAVR